MNPNMDIALNKKLAIERCIKQVRTYYPGSGAIRSDDMRQDAIAANLQRICDLCIDLSNHTIRKKKLGVPLTSGQSFELLHKAGIISEAMAKKLIGMVGFRNILIHEYTKMDIEIFIDVVENKLDTPLDFSQIILELFAKPE